VQRGGGSKEKRRNDNQGMIWGLSPKSLGKYKERTERSRPMRSH